MKYDGSLGTDKSVWQWVECDRNAGVKDAYQMDQVCATADENRR